MHLLPEKHIRLITCAPRDDADTPPCGPRRGCQFNMSAGLALVPVTKSMQPSWVKMRYRRHFATLSDRDNGGGNRTGTDAGLKQCILFRKITPRQLHVPERTRGQIRRKVWRGALKLDAGAQILTGAKANLGGRVDSGTREIVKNRPNRRCTSPSRNMRQHVRQRSAHLGWSNSMRPLPENRARWPIRGFAPFQVQMVADCHVSGI